MKFLTNLERLHLNCKPNLKIGIEISGGVVELSKNLKYTTKLENLYLGCKTMVNTKDNSIDSDGIRSLSENFKYIRNLRRIDLYSNFNAYENRQCHQKHWFKIYIRKYLPTR